jgi:glycyl-tRNA synthetase
MPDQSTFQDIVLRLTEFWKDQGCLVWHPHNVQVGAGTMNPATVLRVLGPEPWNIVYFEPSIRPDDGRFGQNPNRMQQHYQMQVILKPDPGNPQELYLQSLESLGIELSKHDIRFVEDNWEQPALGAWGLGWEVWLDGQEITQFTYFQQAGGINLDPVSVEITYGLDRIVLASQGVDSVWNIDFGADISYGDLLLQSEIEHCKYYFNIADVEALKNVYDSYEKEARRCLEAGLVAPAHDFNLKCSFLFNVLDTRGAIGVTERANYFRRMRNVASHISELYLEQRMRLEYPLLDHPNWVRSAEQRIEKSAAHSPIEVPQRFLLEIGSEELPAGDLESAIRQVQSAAVEMLNELRLSYASLDTMGTPRRLILTVNGLSPFQKDLEMEVKGPPADRAYDATGAPTKAAVGFAKSKGVRTKDLRVITEGDRRYVAAMVHEKGLPSAEVLSEALPRLIGGIKFEKSMRWNSSNISYSRPIRWIVALFGAEVVPFNYAGVQSGRTSRGVRAANSPDIDIASAADFDAEMVRHKIVTKRSERESLIVASASQLAQEVGGMILDDPDLLEEVANLVEQPTSLMGSFEKRFLDLPVEVLVAVMKKHQRYLPVFEQGGKALLPYFITVRNGGDQNLDVVREGNEHVIRARFADADFFYAKDSEVALTSFLPKLDTLTFQADLGSMLDKVKRLEQLTPEIADLLGLNEVEKESSARAAALSKADLASGLVVEMTSLQGIMGGIYARSDGESEEVAQAIAEQYNTISHTRAGLALAIADRIDSLLGLFTAGLAPKGSNDPFALRRAAIQIIENLNNSKIEFDLKEALLKTAQYLPLRASDGDIGEVLSFIEGRLQGYLQEQGIRTAVVRAVLAEQGHNPYSAGTAARQLDEVVGRNDWPLLLDAYSRCVRISRSEPEYKLDSGKLVLEEEQKLYSAYETCAKILDGTVSGLVDALVFIEPAITSFFESVLVMDEDPDIRQNRLALLQKITGLTQGIADLSHLEGF